jgi:excisionase family DNA binding protein
MKRALLKDHMQEEILTIEQAAAYLQIGKRSVYKLAKGGKIPGKKVLNKWRFEKEALRRWVRGERADTAGGEFGVA